MVALNGEQRRTVITTVHAEQPDGSIRQVCQPLDLARCSYAAEPPGNDATEWPASIEALAVALPRYGSRRVTAELGRRGVVATHKRVVRGLRAANLLVAVKRYGRTTDCTHPFGRDPKLVRGLVIARPDQVWSADSPSSRLPREFL